MEIQHWWRMRFSFKNATIFVSMLNIITALFLLHGFLSSASSSNKFSALIQRNSVQLRRIRESEEIRLAMQPLDLIKRVKEIKLETYAEPEMQQDIKQTAALDLSKRLKDIRSYNDASSLRALEEWQKRKMDRARQRELEKNGTNTIQV